MDGAVRSGTRVHIDVWSRLGRRLATGTHAVRGCSDHCRARVAMARRPGGRLPDPERFPDGGTDVRSGRDPAQSPGSSVNVKSISPAQVPEIPGGKGRLTAAA